MSSQGYGHPIFISYRRADAPVYADQVFNILNEQGHFKGQVFMDIETIKPGSKFPLRLKQEIDACDVLIAVIGDRWLELTQARAGAASSDKRDYASEEIARALARGIGVIPVLVGQARMPEENELLEPLKELATVQAIELGERPRKSDLLYLVDTVRGELARVTRERKADGAARRLLGRLGRVWGRARGPLRRRLVQALKTAPLVGTTLVIPNAFIIGALTQWLASVYRRYGSVEYVISDPATYVQLALLQSAAVCVYSGLWLAAYLWLRRREAKRTAADTDKPQNTPRTE